MTDPVVVPAAWLAERLDSVRVVDVRDAWEYEGIGHVPGAVNVPFDSFRSEEHAAERGESGGESEDGDGNVAGEGMLPGAERWATLLGEAGIGPEDTVVAYDDTHGVFAARFLVTALLYGHDVERLHLLDGDYSAWTREHETTTEVPDPEPATYAVEEPADSPLVDRAAVEAAVNSEAVVLDTREQWEYEEGHIPGAVHLDWKDLVDEETRGLKDRAALEVILAERGVTRDTWVVLYCNTARRISHTYVVLRHLGYENVDFYEGSLTEWERAGGPLETGAGTGDGDAGAADDGA